MQQATLPAPRWQPQPTTRSTPPSPTPSSTAQTAARSAVLCEQLAQRCETTARRASRRSPRRRLLARRGRPLVATRRRLGCPRGPPPRSASRHPMTAAVILLRLHGRHALRRDYGRAPPAEAQAQAQAQAISPTHRNKPMSKLAAIPEPNDRPRKRRVVQLRPQRPP